MSSRVTPSGSIDGTLSLMPLAASSDSNTTMARPVPSLYVQCPATNPGASDTPGTTFQCWLDGVITACTSPVTYTGLAHGYHLFAVLGTGPNGIVADEWEEYEWIIAPTVAPLAYIESAPDIETESRSATFVFSSPATGVTFECSLDGGDPFPCTSPRTYGRLPAGTHSFEVMAVYPMLYDPEGNPLELLYEPVPSV